MNELRKEKIAISNVIIKINELNIMCLIENDRVGNNYTKPYVESMKKKILEAQEAIEKYCNLLGLDTNIPTEDTGLCFEPDLDLVDGMLIDVWCMHGDEYMDLHSDLSKQDRIDSLQELLWSVAKMHDLKLYPDDILVSI